jgi:hypothetical protein
MDASGISYDKMADLLVVVAYDLHLNAVFLQQVIKVVINFFRALKNCYLVLVIIRVLVHFWSFFKWNMDAVNKS